MKFCFELYLKSNLADEKQWQQFFNSITAHIGYMNSCQVIITIKDSSVVRFFVLADRDLGVLSNNIEIGVLMPVKNEECQPPNAKGSERFVQYVGGGNFLDLREKVKLKRGKELEYFVINSRRINVEKTLSRLHFYFKNPDGSFSVNKKTMLRFPSHLLRINFDENARYLRKEFPKYINIEKALPVLSPTDNNALLSVNTFPYFANDYYLNLLDYEFDKHSFIIGASGSGKSKFIELLVDRISKTSYKNNYRVLVIDPHASLGEDMKNIEDSQVIDFSGDGAPELFGDAEKTDVSASTELTTTLMKSLLSDQFNPKVERVLRYSLFVLFTAQTMSLGFLKRFLTELKLRNQIMSHVSGNVPPNIEQFFATDYNEIRTTHYTEAVLPIISLVDEMQMQPGLVSENETSLARTIDNNFLSVFSLNKVSMGEKVVKTAAGILIQQIFLLAQARSFNEKVILIVDEVSVVQSPALASILAEARKYNLFVILTQQYFGQVDKSLKDAIYANVYNYYVFRVSEEDAEGLIGNLNIDIPEEIIEAEHKKGIKEHTLKKNFMTELHPRECLVRVSANGQIVPVFKARTLDIGKTNDSKIKVNAADLKEAIPIEAPRVSKCKENKSRSLDDVPEIGANIGDSVLVQAKHEESTKVDDLASSMDEAWESDLKNNHNNVNIQENDQSQSNPEAEIEFFNNYEIDPEDRKQAKEEKMRKADKVARVISKGHIKLEQANAAPISKNFIQTAAKTESGPQSGFGTGNLASLLASQSSSNDIINNRKA